MVESIHRSPSAHKNLVDITVVRYVYSPGAQGSTVSVAYSNACFDCHESGDHKDLTAAAQVDIVD